MTLFNYLTAGMIAHFVLRLSFFLNISFMKIKKHFLDDFLRFLWQRKINVKDIKNKVVNFIN